MKVSIYLRDLKKDAKELQRKLDNIEKQNLPNKFSYNNYGVQYNEIYDKRSGEVKSFKESGLTREEYKNLIDLMSSSPELSEEWINNELTNTAVRTLNSMLGNTGNLTQSDIDEIKKNGIGVLSGDTVRDFIDQYINQVNNYNSSDDGKFDYNLLKILLLGD